MESVKMQHAQNQSSSKSTSPQAAKEVLTGSLILSIMRYPNHHSSNGIRHAQSKAVAASGSCAPTHEPHDSTPPMVNALIDCIGECQGPFTKIITKSDVDAKQNRLILPTLPVDEFIKPLLRTDDNPAIGVPVQTFNAAGKAYLMQFKKRSCSFVLVGNWHKFVEENQLKSSDVLTIWVFRAVQAGGLCFLISSRGTQVLE